MSSKIPTTAQRGTLVASIKSFLDAHHIRLGGAEEFTTERAHHLEVFGIHTIPSEKRHPIASAEFTAIRGPHGTIPIRVLYPSSDEVARKKGEAAALVYFHGGDTQSAALTSSRTGCACSPRFLGPKCTPSSTASRRSTSSPSSWTNTPPSSTRYSGGDSAGGNMTAAVTLRRRDSGMKNLAAQMLLYPEARLPFDTPAAAEHNSGLYLECNGIFSFADHYLPRGTAPGFKYISPGMQSVEYLAKQPPVAVFTSGFDPLRDVGVEYAHKLDEAGVEVHWRHYENLTHGWLQMTAWSDEAIEAVKDVAKGLKKLLYEQWFSQIQAEGGDSEL
ncbi:alpha/beta-hydrolase [Daedalea quercina L-15889]|uniref:Alpha/beta-hydrolase n=1 Tax=Daedalea quercina L-15889 TaxID=1314783 RepID=A0A165TSK8_9APHY|nr:alpha/beta-hydrolase [Daedalea quercina L-15889]